MSLRHQGGLSYISSPVPALGQLSPSRWFMCGPHRPLVSNPLLVLEGFFFGGGLFSFCDRISSSLGWPGASYLAEDKLDFLIFLDSNPRV